ncbi:MAG: M67 family metallopeptidase [Deltaproteobacteria bacterium]|nr:MAG: M67 family metallopeptidase [Deltaproteobacteria bacterium]
MTIICDKTIETIVAYAKKHWPDESCGLLIGDKGQESVAEFIPIKNIYNDMHEKYPDQYPRTAKTAYLIDPKEQQRIFDEAEKNRQEVKCIYHSHCEHDAYFSEEDRLVAAPWGEPSYPGISYLVVSIYNRELKEINEFFWDESLKGYNQKKII